MRTLGYRFPDSCPNGTARTLDGNSGLIARPRGQRCISWAPKGPRMRERHQPAKHADLLLDSNDPRNSHQIA